jgi:hypothetical protein
MVELHHCRFLTARTAISPRPYLQVSGNKRVWRNSCTTKIVSSVVAFKEAVECIRQKQSRSDRQSYSSRWARLPHRLTSSPRRQLQPARVLPLPRLPQILYEPGPIRREDGDGWETRRMRLLSAIRRRTIRRRIHRLGTRLIMRLLRRAARDPARWLLMISNRLRRRRPIRINQ